MQTPVDNPQSTLLSLYDAVTDSPVYRSSTLHFDEQLDLLEKWLELLAKYMKQYVDKLNSKFYFFLFFVATLFLLIAFTC